MSAPDERNILPNTLQSPVSSSEDPTASDLVAAAKDDLANFGNEVRDEAQTIGDEAKAQIGEMVDDVTEKARSLAADQKEMLTGHLEGVASALDRVATELEGEGEPTARYVRMVADGADQLLNNVADRDADELMAMAQDFGRSQPVAFLGAAALLGFAASRFVLASGSRRAESTPLSSRSSDLGGVPSAAPVVSSNGTGQGTTYGASTLGGGNGAT